MGRGRPPRPYVRGLAEARATAEAFEREKERLQQAHHRPTQEGAIAQMLLKDRRRWGSRRNILRRLKLYREIQQIEQRVRDLYRQFQHEGAEVRRRLVALRATAIAKQMKPPAEIEALLLHFQPSEI